MSSEKNSVEKRQKAATMLLVPEVVIRRAPDIFRRHHQKETSKRFHKLIRDRGAQKRFSSYRRDKRENLVEDPVNLNHLDVPRMDILC